MNTTKININNKTRNKAYTYYIVVFSKNGNKHYFRDIRYPMSTQRNESYRFYNKSSAKLMAKAIRRNTTIEVLQPYKSWHVNILRIRGLSKPENQMMEMVNL